MRGGQRHQLVEVNETGAPWRYRCLGCGEQYRVRTSFPSCRIRFLERIEQLQAQLSSNCAGPRRELLGVLVRRHFQWPKPLREAMLDHFERWQTWKKSAAATNAHG
jgi:hypothetical protein